MLFPQLGWNSPIPVAILALYLCICFVLARRNAAPRAWWIPLGLILSATYLHGMQISRSVCYGGITGDCSFEVGYTNNVIHGNYLGDAYAKTVPTDYSLLYFWILGTIARLTGLDGVTAWLLAPAALLLCTPFIVYHIGSNLKDQETGFWCCVAFFGLGAYHTQWFIAPERRWGTYDFLINKPHELLAMLLLVYWFTRISGRTADNKIGYRSLLASGAVGTLVALGYYPAFALGTMAMAIHGFVERDSAMRRRILAHAGSFGLLGVVLSSPGWFPYVSALLTRPHEPTYRADYVALWNFDPTLYTFGLGYFGALFCLGALALKDFVHDKAIRLLLILVAACYAAVLATFVLYPLAGLSFLPRKWSEFLLVVFGVLAGRGLQIAIGWLRRQPSRLLVYAALLLFIPSPLLWNRFTDNELSPAASDWELVAVARAIVGACEPSGGDQALTVLATRPVAYAIPAVSQWRLYLAPQIHFSTPPAQYKLSANKVRQLGRIDTPSDMDRAVRSMGISLLVMGKGESAYLLEVDRGSRPSSLFVEGTMPYDVVRIRPRLFSAQYFARVYEDEQSLPLRRFPEIRSRVPPKVAGPPAPTARNYRLTCSGSGPASQPLSSSTRTSHAQHQGFPQGRLPCHR